jgi:hypothetical protein
MRLEVLAERRLECPNDVARHRLHPRARHADSHIRPPWRREYRDAVRPVMVRLAEEGRIVAWGISATGDAPTVIGVLEDDPAPDVAQVESNVLRSAAASGSSAHRPGATELIAAAVRCGVSVMCVCLTVRGARPAWLAHRYAPHATGRRYRYAHAACRFCCLTDAFWGCRRIRKASPCVISRSGTKKTGMK